MTAAKSLHAYWFSVQGGWKTNCMWQELDRMYLKQNTEHIGFEVLSVFVTREQIAGEMSIGCKAVSGEKHSPLMGEWSSSLIIDDCSPEQNNQEKTKVKTHKNVL